MTAWMIVDNPAWEGREPDHLTESNCHDRTHIITIECSCGCAMHLHESQVNEVPINAHIAMPCHQCGDLLTFDPLQLQGWFAELRRAGWIV